ncbi:HAD family phosphatase [Eubacteriales bacterium OttesenSCG-928-M02]|nr:HAD family phosphatase [Eubacteriales bacterium OttesenSCG-928-M02]
MPDTILFDMDGLMFDTELLNQQITIQTCLDYGYTLPLADFRRTIGEGRAVTYGVFRECFGDGFSMEEYLIIQGEIHARTLSYAQTQPVPKKKGLDTLLAYLTENGYCMGLCTSSALLHAQWFLDSVGIRPLFSAIVGGDMVEQHKPHPAPYEALVALLGVQKSQCLVLEDGNNGILSAHRAGLQAVMIPDILPPTQEARAYSYAVVDSLLDVPPILDTLRAGESPTNSASSKSG